MLEAPRTAQAPAKSGGAKAPATRRVPGEPRMRRDLTDDFARPTSGPASRVQSPDADQPYVPRRRFGIRFRLRGGMPRSVVGRAAAGAAFLGGMGVLTAVLWGARALLLHDPRLLIASSSSIQTTGNSHLSRAQMLSVFGGDVDHNILQMPLDERRAELESLPWVEHATVMRLLPNRIRVAVVERTPVAFVREGSHIGLVDANGVLLEMSPDVPADQHYSFPVVTGVTGDEPLGTRAARMALYRRFTDELDSGSDKISGTLSEVDLSSPEDVQALIPTESAAGKSDVLVHFGDAEFLPRYKRFQRNIADWKASKPNLEAVDMRYDGNAVLEMRSGTTATSDAPATTDSPAAKTKAPKTAVGAAKKLVVKPASAARPGAKPDPPKPRPLAATSAKPAGHLEQAFDVPAKPHPTSSQAAPR